MILFFLIPVAGPLNIFWVQFENNSFLSGTEESFIIESGQTINVPLYFTPDDEVREYISSLTIYNDGSGEQNFIMSANAQSYFGFFDPVDPTGLPYNISITSLEGPMGEIEIGDEIGIFDGALAVGTIVVQQDNISGYAWGQDVENGLDGFTNGNPITLVYFSNITNNSHLVEYSILSGDGNFGTDPFTVFAIEVDDEPLSIALIDEIEDITILEDNGPDTLFIDLNQYFFSIFGNLSFSVMSSDTSALIADNMGSNGIILNPKTNWFGETDIYLFASYGNLETIDTIKVFVTNVNDVPFSDPFSFEMLEDEEYNGNLIGTDYDNDDLVF